MKREFSHLILGAIVPGHVVVGGRGVALQRGGAEADQARLYQQRHHILGQRRECAAYPARTAGPLYPRYLAKVSR